LSRLILLHGFAGLPAFWAPVRRHLPLEVEVLAPALAGHGGPPPVAGDGAFLEEVDRLARLIQQRNFTSAHLVGYSLGGRLALGLAVQFAELFSGATLIGAHPGLVDPEERRRRIESDEIWARQLEEEGLEAFLDAWQAQPLFSTQSAEQRQRQRRLRRALSASALAAALRAFSLGRMPAYRSALAALPLPVRWVAGSADTKFLEIATQAALAHPRGTLTSIEGAGHNVVLEQPQALARLLTTPLFPTPSHIRHEGS
jgi:2-succinyl-6-hydroxy-2,4-cyclohexadiene-1-carboxylate synthase